VTTLRASQIETLEAVQTTSGMTASALAKLQAVHHKTAYKRLEDLAARGHLRKEFHRQRGGGAVNVYRLTPQGRAELSGGE
jgi:predicted ArsR family transcriptional regulator